MGEAQAATEYLIILAVVVIIVLIIIAVLGGFPAMSKGISERDSASYWAGADVGITRYSLAVPGSPAASSLMLKNNKNFPITIMNISFDGRNTTGFQAQAIQPRAAAAVNISSSGLNCGAPGLGQGYSRNVTIYYIDTQSGYPYTFGGEKPLVGTCQ